MSIHRTAVIDPKAEIESDVEIGPYVVIEGPVKVKRGTGIMAHAYLTGWTEIGEDNEIHPGAVLGDAPQDKAYKGEETYLKVGDHNIIREYVQIHRGTVPGSATIVVIHPPFGPRLVHRFFPASSWPANIATATIEMPMRRTFLCFIGSFPRKTATFL